MDLGLNAMTELMLLGDEAIGIGAIHAGLSVAYGYPGTPSTEILEFILNYIKQNKEKQIYAAWCSNEKTAYEEALGVSMVGKRALVTMKHVGLNVAADPFISSAILKIKGGLVLAVADDPGMHASQNEQDSRFYSDFAHIVCFEPHSQQEAYEMAKEAFAISERFRIPVVIRIVTRLAHSRAKVKFGKINETNPLSAEIDKTCWMTLPVLAKKSFAELLAAQTKFQAYAEESIYNPLYINNNFVKFGVITTGIAVNYYKENLDNFKVKPSHLHIGVYPMPVDKIRRLAQQVDKLVVMEEGYPFVEKRLRGILPTNKIIIGKEDALIPQSGELTPDNIRPALGLIVRETPLKKEIKLPNRPPQLCQGCPHTSTFVAIKKIVADIPTTIVTSDIGCYSLGAVAPFDAIDSMVCMGASIGMAKGAVEAGAGPVIATIDDGTFIHSGMSSLVDCIAAKINVTIIIMDNSIVAMTGGQETILPSSKLKQLIMGMGVEPEHIKNIIPLPKNLEDNIKIIKEEMAYKGVSIILSARECIQYCRQK